MGNQNPPVVNQDDLIMYILVVGSNSQIATDGCNGVIRSVITKSYHSGTKHHMTLNIKVGLARVYKIVNLRKSRC